MSLFRSFGSSARSFLVVAMVALAGAVLVTSGGAADARLGGGGTFGSRGSRTFSMPSATPTAPSMAPFARPSSGYNPGYAARPGFLGGGFGRGLLGGFLGAGLFGMLFGGSFGGGLGGGMSIIGLLLQVGLLYFAFRFIMGFFGNRRPAFGGGLFGGGGAPVAAGAMGGFGQAQARPQGTPITIGPDDYQAFERQLVASQLAYSNGDLGALRRIATPQMAGSFEEELAANARQGVVNKLADVRLLQGDLSEAWREAGSDYATVAMKFSLIDTTVEQASGRVVAGNPGVSQIVTEVWTFVRQAGASPAGWTLSAIQQA